MRPSGNHAQAAIVRSIVAIAGLSDADRQKPMLIVEDVRSSDWASATFVGATHDLVLRIEGEAAAVAAASEKIETELPEYDIVLSGHIVAEIVVLPGETLVTDDYMVSKLLTVNALVIQD
jgi:hypothetical protein